MRIKSEIILASATALQTELDENLSKNRSLQMETQQFKEQLR